MTNIEAFDTAKRKARYGHRNQIVWKDRNGTFHTAPRSPASIKSALLASGTAGRFSEIDGRGVGHVIHWSTGIRMIRNARFGC